MKRHILIFAATLLGLLSCQNLDKIYDELDDHNQRLAELESFCKRLNNDISSLQDIVIALEKKDAVTSVTPLIDNGKETGYLISFASGTSIKIWHGSDGTSGKDGKSPQIGVRQDEDGLLCWTLNGEWIRDGAGNKIHAAGKDGMDGKDGVVPQLQIKEGWWEVSYDGGKKWERLDTVPTGASGCIFSKVETTGASVDFHLSGGEVISLPKYTPAKISFNIQGGETGYFAGETVTINYTISGGSGENLLTASSDGNFIVRVERTDAYSGKLMVRCPDPAVNGFINVLLSDGKGYSEIKVINLYENKIDFPQGLEYTVSSSAQTLSIPLNWNMAWNASISTTDAGWLSIVPQTKASMKEGLIQVEIKSNENSTARSGKIEIRPEENPSMIFKEITVRQEGPKKPMTLKVRANIDNNYTAILPLGGAVDCSIDWGDGKTSKVALPSVPAGYIRHTYNVSETTVFTVKISGKVEKLNSFNINVPISEIVHWGDLGLKDMSAAFYECKLLEKVAAEGAESLKDVVDFSQAFKYCSRLNSVGAGLFSHCTKATDFGSVFEDCTALADVPADLFLNCSEAKIMKKAFKQTMLSSIPENFLKSCTKLEDCSEMFWNCVELTTIYPDLFSYCPDLTLVYKAFMWCGKLNIPYNLFDNNRKLQNFYSTFQENRGSTGDSPYTMIDGVKVHLYERMNYPDHFTKPTSTKSCFYGCSFSDMEQIPTNWK